MEIRNGMKMTRNVTQAKVRLKNLLGLPKRTSNLDLLQAIGHVFEANDMGKDFNEYMTKFNMEEHGIDLVYDCTIPEEE